jgi:hypothetical protein
MKKALLVSSALSLGILAAVPASALVVIDDFSSGAVAQSITSGSLLDFQNGTMSGGDRGLKMEVTSNAFSLSYQVNTVTGTFNVSSQAGVDGYTQIGYGYFNNAGAFAFQDLNLDLSGEDRFEMDILSHDQPVSVTMSLRSAGATQMITKNLPGNMVNTPMTLTYNFSEWTTINFADIDQILVEFNTQVSGDLTIDSIEAVPEPATMTLLAGALALAARRKKRS